MNTVMASDVISSDASLFMMVSFKENVLLYLKELFPSKSKNRRFIKWISKDIDIPDESIVRLQLFNHEVSLLNASLSDMSLLSTATSSEGMIALQSLLSLIREGKVSMNTLPTYLHSTSSARVMGQTAAAGALVPSCINFLPGHGHLSSDAYVGINAVYFDGHQATSCYPSNANESELILATSMLTAPCISSTPTSIEKFTFIELFCGIGGFRFALEPLGGRCVYACDIDHNARTAYKSHFGDMPHGDITKVPVDAIPNHDILTAGFPCQPFSQAGGPNPHGFAHRSRGTLFWEIIRIADKKRPRALLLENVPGLVTVQGGSNLEIILSELSRIGYAVAYRILDARLLVPQRRKRVYIVAIRNNIVHCDHKSTSIRFQFPFIPDLRPELHDVLENECCSVSCHGDGKYGDAAEHDTTESIRAATLSEREWFVICNEYQSRKQPGLVSDFYGPSATLISTFSRSSALLIPPRCGWAKSGILSPLPLRRNKDREGNGPCDAGPLNDETSLCSRRKFPRVLTARECARLQGFPESLKLVTLPGDKGLEYPVHWARLFGNAICVPVVVAVADSLLRAISFSSNASSNLEKCQCSSCICPAIFTVTSTLLAASSPNKSLGKRLMVLPNGSRVAWPLSQ